jgi:hypothetical protein
VVATSSLQPDVKLNATGFGNLKWNATTNLYAATFTGVPAKPASVTVSSSVGGSATMAIP